MQHVVVTGSAGFVGTHLSRALLASGTKVIGVDRREHPADLTTYPTFHPVTADLLTTPLDPLFSGVDAVFHLAGVPGVRPSWGREFNAYAASNIQATHRLMDTAIRLHVPRVVLASSSSVYGPTNGTPSTETDTPRPASPYAITKLAAEQLCLAHAARPDSTTTVVALRYFTVYGPGQRPDMLIHRALTAALTGSPLKIFGDGLQQRDFTYVDDVVRATIAAAATPTPDTVCNVGGGSSSTLTEVISLAEELAGSRIPVDRRSSRPGDVPATLANPARARQLLDWKPEIELPTGMALQLDLLRKATV